MPTKTLQQKEITLPELIPENIQNNIKERWFHLYNWISPSEIKASIQRDYLKILSKVWIWIWGAAIIWALITGWLTPISLWIFFWILALSYGVILAYLSIISLKRSITLTNAANIVLTDTAISIDGEIIPYKDLEKHLWRIQEIWKEFDEPLFWESNLEKTKGDLLQETISSTWEAWGTWFKLLGNFDRWNGRDMWQIILIIIVLGLLYTSTMGIVYFAGLFFIWIFSLITSIINRFILRISWHKVQLINDKFEQIDTLSKSLDESSKNISSFLNEAKKNNWKDALLLKINDGIDNVNKATKDSLETSNELKSLLENSKYKDIFNFPLYGNWIKARIIIPLENIKELLEKNYLIIENTIKDIEKQMHSTSDSSLAWPLQLQKERLGMQKNQFEKQTKMIWDYLEKLK